MGTLSFEQLFWVHEFIGKVTLLRFTAQLKTAMDLNSLDPSIDQIVPLLIRFQAFKLLSFLSGALLPSSMVQCYCYSTCRYTDGSNTARCLFSQAYTLCISNALAGTYCTYCIIYIAT